MDTTNQENIHPNINATEVHDCFLALKKKRPAESAFIPNTTSYGGYSYTIKDRSFMANEKGEVGYFNCTYFRGKNCKATLTVKHLYATPQENAYISKNAHTCCSQIVAANTPLDVFDTMAEAAAQKALDKPSEKAKVIAQEVLDDMKNEFSGQPITNVMRFEQIVNKVYNTRRAEFSNWEEQLQCFPLQFCGTQRDKPFLQFLRKFNNKTSWETVIGWAHPDLIFLLTGCAVKLFFDMTFKVVPKPFTQLMIVMLHCPFTLLYIPVFYVLLESKTEMAYFIAIECIIGATDWKIEATSITCDFELGLIKTLTKQFPTAPTIFCLFHWKQALRRKLIGDFDFPKEMVTWMLGPEGVLNILTVIPEEEVVSKGIPFVTMQVLERYPQVEEALKKFFSYFVATWTKRFPISFWNISSIQWELVQARTNNAVERFNRTLNETFSTAHPSMVIFVERIRELSETYVQSFENIKAGVQAKPGHQLPQLFQIPESYDNFNPPNKKTRKS